MKKRVIAAICVFAVLVVLVLRADISVQTVLHYTPKSPLLAAGALLLLYVVKSVVMVFPMVIPEIAAGLLLPGWAALTVNFLGLLIVLTIPYGLGRHMGMAAVERSAARYSRFGALLARQQANSFFLCFFLRIIGCLPGDFVTLYLGASKTPFLQNLVGGAAGMLPEMALATLLGAAVQDPASPVFWLSAALMAALSAASFLGYYLYRRHLQKKER